MQKLDYTNLSDVLNETVEVLVIDLLEYALTLDSKYLDMLEEPEKGVYISGSIKPIIKFHKHIYFPISLYNENTARLTNYDSIMICNEDIVNESADVVLTLKDKHNKKKYLLPEPNIPITAISLALTMSDNYLSTLCEFSRKQYVTLNYDKLIKQEHLLYLDQDKLEMIFRKLLNKISLFIRNDLWNIYFIKQKGTSLIIEKSIDWRIYKYYEMMLEDNSED